MDPDQNKTPDQNLPVPETSNSYMNNVNKPQTPAYNNTDYWNQATENVEPKITEPVNPPEPLAPSETPAPVDPQPPTPEPPPMTPPTPDTSSQTTTDPSYQKWDDPPSTPVSTTPPPPPPPLNEPSSPTPNSSNTTKIVLAVAAIVLLSVGGLFAFQQYQSKTPVAVSPTPAPTLEAVATPDPTSNGKTYSNATYKFEFNYPSSWLLVEGYPERVLIFDDPSNKESGNQFNVELTVDSPSVGRNINPSDPIGTKRTIAEGVVKEKIENITLGGLSASKSNVTVLPQSGTDAVAHTVVETKIGTKFLTIRLIPWNKTTVQPGFDQILSTFRFTSAGPSASPVSTNTCDKGYKAFSASNYSLCYPETLKQTTTDANSAVVLFENANETLKVTQNFQGGWGGSQCLFIDKTTVSGYASKRLSWKTEQKTGGGCDNTFDSFAEMINEGNFKFPFPYALELIAKKAPFQDNSQFLTIEKSFQVTNPNPTP